MPNIRSVYHSWTGMKQRCDNPSNKDYSSYGGRGIKIHPDWYKFSAFKQDMGDRPEGYILDRIDVDKGYFKENCRWIDPVTSGLNRRPFTGEAGLRKNNKSGIGGVSLLGNRWIAVAKKVILYRGDSFFEACCARKAFEAYTQREVTQ